MIAHFDVDAFYAAVAVREDPSLRGKPLAIAGESRRAVVLTASYEARPFGVRSAMPLYRARLMCPELVVVPPNHRLYRDVSREVFAIFADGARAVEGLSLDEAFVDAGAPDAETMVAFATRVRARVSAEIGITVSAGIASGKMIAKIASDSCKPDGLAVVPAGTEAAYLTPLPVGRLWGIGPKSQARLAEAGIATIGDVAALDDARAFALFGRGGKSLRELARGHDDRAVSGERETVSVSTEETFEFDVREHARLREVLREQSAEIVERLRGHGFRGATIGVKIKGADFKVRTRQTKLAEPTDAAETIFAAAERCLARAHADGTPVRLLGIRIGDLTAGQARQIALF